MAVRNDQAIAAGDKLDSGMSGREAVRLARIWWDNVGRHVAGKIGHDDAFMASLSGICAGDRFDDLSNGEQVRVVKTWHHVFVRRADVLDVAPDVPFKLGGKEVVQ